MYVNARLPNSCGAGDRNYTTDIGVALFFEIFEGPLRRVQDAISLLQVSPGLHRPFYKVAFHSKHRYARVPLLLRIIFSLQFFLRLIIFLKLILSRGSI